MPTTEWLFVTYTDSGNWKHFFGPFRSWARAQEFRTNHLPADADSTIEVLTPPHRATEVLS